MDTSNSGLLRKIKYKTYNSIVLKIKKNLMKGQDIKGETYFIELNCYLFQLNQSRAGEMAHHISGLLSSLQT